MPAFLSNKNSIYPANNAIPIQNATINATNEPNEYTGAPELESMDANAIAADDANANAKRAPVKNKNVAIIRCNHIPNSLFGNFRAIHMITR